MSAVLLTACTGGKVATTVEAPAEELGFEFEKTVNEEGETSVKVKRGENVFGRLRLAEGDWTVGIYDKGPRYTFFGATPNGLGGAIAFDGPMVIARYDSVTEDFGVKDFSRSEYPGTVRGVSQDGEMLAYTIVTESGVKMVVAKDLFDANADAPIYEVPAEFSQAGAVSFSKDNKKMAYVTYNMEPDDSEKTALFVVDLESGEQREVARRTVTVTQGVYTIKGWEAGNPLFE